MSLRLTAAQLKEFDGSNPEKPIYVAIKGQVYDVSASRDMYTPPKGYSVFAGKDASKALGKSSLKAEDAIADYSDLNAEELDTLNKWEEFYKKKYSIVGTVEQQ